MTSCVMPSQFPVTAHTDFVGLGSTFVVIKGYKHNGIDYIPEAIKRGASTIVIQESVVIPQNINDLINLHNVTIERVEDTRAALATLSAQAAGYPARSLRIIGITGTKGKSTSSALVAHLLQQSGYQTALLSTVHNKIGATIFPAPLTTAQPDYLHQFFKLALDHGVTHVVMEVAAQALSLHRIDTIQFDGIIFTNFSQEHAEFYPSMQDYFSAKTAIFSHAKPGACRIVNYDNDWCKTLSGDDITTFSFQSSQADICADLKQQIPFVRFGITYQGVRHEFECPSLIGSFNAYNAGMAIALCQGLGIPAPLLADALTTFPGVPGRMQRHLLPNNATAIIDYAHNPSSFENLFIVLRQLTHQLIVVFGAGGERDRTKRPQMGAIAAEYADLVIITTDNPRSEDPATITHDILAGISNSLMNKVICEPDREKAIEMAYQLSSPHAIIALLGKGPDEYQMIGTIKYPFSEAQILARLTR